MSLLIIGGEEEERKEKALFIAKEQFRSSNFDLHSFPPEGKLQIGIEEAFEAKRKSNFKPFNSAFTTLLFLELQRATIEAQNALLKLIEEPPKTTKILITAQNESLLPAPIVSRCTFLRLKIPKNRLTEEKETRFALEILFLFAAGIGKRLEKAEKLAKDKKEALDYLRNVIFSARFVIFSRLRIYESALAKKIAKISSYSDLANDLKKPDFEIADGSLDKKMVTGKLLKLIDKFARARVVLEYTNVNPRLILENLLLEFCS